MVPWYGTQPNGAEMRRQKRNFMMVVDMAVLALFHLYQIFGLLRGGVMGNILLLLLLGN